MDHIGRIPKLDFIVWILRTCVCIQHKYPAAWYGNVSQASWQAVELSSVQPCRSVLMIIRLRKREPMTSHFINAAKPFVQWPDNDLYAPD